MKTVSGHECVSLLEIFEGHTFQASMIVDEGNHRTKKRPILQLASTVVAPDNDLGGIFVLRLIQELPHTGG